MPKVKGAFIDVVHVENYNTTNETETLLDLTTGDVEIAIDETEISREVLTEERVNRDLTHNSVDLNITSLFDPTMSALQETGIISDVDGSYTMANRTWEACRLRSYPDKSGSPADQVIDLLEVQWTTEGVTFPDDFAESGLTGMVHGDIRFNQ